MPRFLGLFWWIQQIINKYISQRKVTLGVFQMRTVTYTLYQDLHHLEQHGLYLSVNVKSRNKCNIETKYFFSVFHFEQDNIKNGGEKRRKGRDEE